MVKYLSLTGRTGKFNRPALIGDGTYPWSKWRRAVCVSSVRRAYV